MSATPLLTDAERTQFHELGYIVLRGVLSPQELADLEREAARIVATDGSGTRAQHYYEPSSKEPGK